MTDGCQQRAKRRRRSHALPRRKTVRWSSAEVDGLLEGVREHGVGKWAAILRSSACFNAVRTSVDLKDKWRNLAAHVRALALQGAPNSAAGVPPPPLPLPVPKSSHMPLPVGPVGIGVGVGVGAGIGVGVNDHHAPSLSVCSPVSAIGSPVQSPPRRPRPGDDLPRVYATATATTSGLPLGTKPEVAPLTFKTDPHTPASTAMGVGGPGTNIGTAAGNVIANANATANPTGPFGSPAATLPAPAPLQPALGAGAVGSTANNTLPNTTSGGLPLAPIAALSAPGSLLPQHATHAAHAHAAHAAYSHANSLASRSYNSHPRVLAPLPLPIAPAPEEPTPSSIAPMPAIPELPPYFGDFSHPHHRPNSSSINHHHSEPLAHLRTLQPPTHHHSPHDAVPTATAPDNNPSTGPLSFDPFPVGDSEL